jgi:predicted amidohydrolase YtcJ
MMNARLHVTVFRRLAMSRMRVYLAAVVLTSSMAFAPGTLAGQQDKIDVTGKWLFTVTTDAGNRIIAVGTNAEVARVAAPNARRIDLQGRTVTPGLLDAHAHFSGGGADRLFVIDLRYPNVKNMADVAAAIRDKVATTPKGGWIQGRGWDEGKLTERRVITAKDLDAVSPDNPVFLTQTTGHYGVANAKAFNAEGMTGLKDPGISSQTWDLYRKVERDSALSVRVFALWTGGRSVDGARRLIAERAAMTRPYENTGDDRVIAGGVKLYIDGSGGARTAWLYDDWNKDYRGVDAGNRGYPTSNADTIRLLIRMYHDAGMHVSVHSIGDRAIDWVVDTYDQAMRENPKKGLRHGIIHANIPTDHAIDVMARLQRDFDAGFPEPSATFAWWLGDTYAGNFGPTRSLRLNPFKTFRSKGMIWANGSDFPVTPFPARYAIWSAIAREPLLGVYGRDPFGRAESVDVHTALHAVAIWAARQMFLETKVGSVEVGKYADLAVWDRDFYAVPTTQIKDAKCLMTIFDGKIVFQAADAKF